VTRPPRLTRAEPDQALLRKIHPFVAPHRGALTVVLALAVAASSIAALEPLAVKLVFDGLESGNGLRVVVAGLAGMLAAIVSREVLGAVLDARIWRTRIAIHFGITRATVDRLHSLPLSFHERESVGAVMTKMDRGINGFCAAFGDVLFHIVPSLVYLVIAAGLMVNLDWRLSTVALVFAPLPPIIGARAAKEQAERERGLLARWARVFGRFNEILSGMAVVKSFAMEEVEKRRFLTGVEEANAIVVRGVRTDARTSAAKNLAVGFARLSALALGGLLHFRGEVSIGTLMAFLGYVGALFGPLQGLTGAY
jgi:ATP-binding cassette subfamily B protein